jgi:hypothetical protein
MMRKIRRSVLLVVAAMALFAVSVSSAAGEEFHFDTEHAVISGQQSGEDVYTFNAGTWSCKTKSYSGTSTVVTTTTLSLTPSFAECVAFKFTNPTLDLNGCSYQYHTQKEGTSTRSMSIVCPEGKSMVLTVFNCYVTIPAQSGLTSVTYADEGSGKSRDVKVSHSITGLKYTQESKSFPGCTGGTFTNGTYSGTTTLKAANTAGEQVSMSITAGVSMEHETATEHEAETAHEKETEEEPVSGEFHSEASHTTWSGAQAVANTMTFNVGSWKCENVSYSGTSQTATGGTVLLTPGFSQCNVFGFINAVHDMNGCQYQFHAGTNGMDIVCPEGKSIGITTTICDVTLPSQNGRTEVSYANAGSGASRDVTIDLAVTGLEYTQKFKTFPGCTNGTFTNGTLSGSITLKGLNTSGVQVGAWVG